MTVNRLFTLLAMASFTLMSVLFTYYFVLQREQTAQAIVSSVRNHASELSYLISRNISSNLPVNASRALLDRVAANNDYISAIALFDQDRLLLATDPAFMRMPDHRLALADRLASAYEVLTSRRHLQTNVRYFEGATPHTYQLVLFLDHGFIDQYMNLSQRNILVYLLLMPVLLLLILAVFIRLYLTRPLSRLRQFAYYHDRVPEAFKLRELEAIRHTLDLTFKRLEAEQKSLYDNARKDMLSGLSNRYALQEYVTNLVSESARVNECFAFLFMDIDNFKSINDSLGHDIGDQVIRQVSKGLLSVMRRHDFVSRVGGDEFVLVIKHYRSQEELAQITERMLQHLSLGFDVEGFQIKLTSSIGIAEFPTDGDDFLSLMKNADIAMFEAKQRGKSGYHFFSNELNERVQLNIRLDRQMRAALVNDEYQLYYQPKVDLRTGSVIGAEALIRWIKPDGSVVSPNDFIPLAEENGFIVELGAWVIDEAIQQLRRWQVQGLDWRLSVNIATKQLYEQSFEAHLMECIQAAGLEPGKLELEITEYLFMAQTQSNTNRIERLRQKGFKIALDDFGTGYSSLSYLKRFPIDQLKIDKLFLDDFQVGSGAVFLETIVKLAKSLNMDVIAEGVETKEQARVLESLGCYLVQGYLYSRPLPIDAFEAWAGAVSGSQRTLLE
ncbi:MAG: putative bifunctional diguanylate cyclase/phosphodiesterase [Saccharospirillum sp.]